MTNTPTRPVSPDQAPESSPRWRRLRPGQDRNGPLVFWVTMLVLGCVSFLFMSWGAAAYLAQKGPEKLLRAEQLLPKLKSIHWQWKPNSFHLSGPTQQAKAPSKERNAPPVQAAPPPGAALEPHHLAVAPPLVMAPAYDEPISITPATPTYGDSPMMRNWKMLSLYSMLAAGAALAPPPMVVAQDDSKMEKLIKDVADLTRKVDNLKPASDPELIKAVQKEINKLSTGPLADIDEELKSIKKSVNKVNTEISNLQGKQLEQKRDIDRLTDEVNALRAKLNSTGPVPASQSSPVVDKAFMELLSEIRKLSEQIAKLGATETRTAMSPPIKNGAAAAPGKVVFNNLYSRELLFIVNGQAYPVAPKMGFTTSVPSGMTRLEVFAEGLGVLDRRSINVSPGESFTLRATDQP